MRHRGIFAMLIAFAASACAVANEDASDVEAESAPEQALGQVAAPSFTGLYATTTMSLRDGDLPNIQLLADGTYVRRRCYHAGCALPVAETDHYDSYTSSAGKTYLRFYSFVSVWNAAHDDRTQAPVIADVYEVVKTSTTLKLRKAYSSRWLTLHKTTATALCTADHGTWVNSDCSCPGEGGWSDDGYVAFVAGLGGCSMIPAASETECDETEGYYTDDDATLTATYCQCERGSYLSNMGCAAL